MSLAFRTRRPWVTTSTVLCAALVMVAVSPEAAQTPAQIEAEPLVQLQPGETLVEGECLTQQELDLLAGLAALRRPTVGVEGEGEGDDKAPFNPHFYVGAWEIEGVLPESPLGPAGEFLGTETVRYLGGCTYESTVEATIDGNAVTTRVQMFYDRRSRYLVRLEEDSRGFRLVKSGRVEVRRGGRQVQDHAADRTDDVRPQFGAEPRHLGTGTGGARRAQAEFLHQHVGGGGEEHAQLIGPEATAARAVDLQAIEQFLDAVLDVAAGQ